MNARSSPLFFSGDLHSSPVARAVGGGVSTGLSSTRAHPSPTTTTSGCASFATTETFFSHSHTPSQGSAATEKDFYPLTSSSSSTSNSHSHFPRSLLSSDPTGGQSLSAASAGGQPFFTPHPRQPSSSLFRSPPPHSHPSSGGGAGALSPNSASLNGAAIPSSCTQAVQLENDHLLEALLGNVRSTRRVAESIGHEIQSQNALLEQLQQLVGAASASLTKTLRRVNKFANSNSSYLHFWVLLLFIFVVFMFVYCLLRSTR